MGGYRHAGGESGAGESICKRGLRRNVGAAACGRSPGSTGDESPAVSRVELVGRRRAHQELAHCDDVFYVFLQNQQLAYRCIYPLGT